MIKRRSSPMDAVSLDLLIPVGICLDDRVLDVA